MSENKKSKVIPLIILLLIILAGIFLWNNYGKKLLGSADKNATEQTAGQTEDKLTFGEEDHDHDHDHDHEHGEKDNMINADVDVGDVGTVTEIPVRPALGVRALGDPNAPVTVREYFSLTCNHCAEFHKGTFQQLKSKYIDTGKLYFIYEEMPLNGPALYGSMIARCLPESRYPEFVSLLLNTQAQWAFGGDFRAELQKNAALAGMSEDEFNTCFENEELRTAIAENIDASAQAWKISSTPSFVFNDGERILRGGKPIASFDAVYDLLTNKTTLNETAPLEVKEIVGEVTNSITSPVSDVEAFQPNGKVITPNQAVE